MDEAQLRALQQGDADIADVLGLPVQSEAWVYDIYRMTPRPGQYPVGFKSTVAPILQGNTKRAGGASQTLVPNRSLYTDPELIDRLLQE